MKPIIVFVITFVVATAASTAGKVAMTPAPVAADSTKADSLQADSSKAEAAKKGTDTAAVASGETTPPATEPVKTTAEGAKPATPGTAGAAGAPAVAQAGTPATQVANTANAKEAPDTAVTESEKRIAKVFTAMDAKQAAKVLEHMSDGDVHIILGYVGVKQAAQIMAALPPERVATLSKIAMGRPTK